jgi:signal transduction histidine kinase
MIPQFPWCEAFHRRDARVACLFEGTGLGLSVAGGLVEMQGGTAWPESEPMPHGLSESAVTISVAQFAG